ncbi:MAG: carbamoyltransferase family protein [Candidatus Binatia bacterium]
MIILGINAYHGDASAALVVDGQLVAAVEEERFTRIKHCAGFPARAVAYCLEAAGIKPAEIDHIAVAKDPRARLMRKALYAIKIPRLAIERLGAWNKFATVKEEIGRALDVSAGTIKADTHNVEHHQAHLASSFFVSPFEEAALLSVDGLGDFASMMWGAGRGSKLEVRGSIAFPHSLGIFYTALTQYLGFWNYGDEYKVMGLAAYGEPAYKKEFRKIVGPPSNGVPGFALNLDYFVHHKTGPEMTWREGTPSLGKLYSEFLIKRLGPAREAKAPVEKRHENIAASMQARLEEVMLPLLYRLHDQTECRNLCMAGGVALNCTLNGKILDHTPFEALYIQPAAGDSGLAIGAAFYVWHQILRKPRSFEMKHSYWGPEFGEQEIRKALAGISNCELRIADWSIRDSRSAISHQPYATGSHMPSAISHEPAGLWIAELPEEELVRITAEHIAGGKIVGWYQGRTEWGPRALGNRSIVADPRRPEMKDILNSRIKHRELFRPFAPSILKEAAADYFEQSYPSPFMLMTYKVRAEKRQAIPAPTHVDGTGRLQTVSKDENPLYWRLIKEFDRLTGVPVLLNTSFNDNEPIVCTPEEALDCFLRTKMDVLVMGRHVVERAGS